MQGIFSQSDRKILYGHLKYFGRPWWLYSKWIYAKWLRESKQKVSIHWLAAAEINDQR